ncbi:hypothetical protein V6N13_098258 [Hibiscus sabdariffa]|uniref:Uncharacterized protein n=1 Tax=Hibiscus sabdariffa TaxID=183260 RepID=A0ABR2ED90_9ROSI
MLAIMPMFTVDGPHDFRLTRLALKQGKKEKKRRLQNLHLDFIPIQGWLKGERSEQYGTEDSPSLSVFPPRMGTENMAKYAVFLIPPNASSDPLHMLC